MSDLLIIVRQWLVNGDNSRIRKYAEQKASILSILTALTYDLDLLVSWRAVEALGIAAGVVGQRDPEYVRGHLRRLMWLLNDESGGIGWRAPEAIGEIIRSDPVSYAEFIPLLISILELEAEDAGRFSAGTLWAIGRLSEVVPKSIGSAIPLVIPLLGDLDPQVRGMAVWCLDRLDTARLIPEIEPLKKDLGAVILFRDGQIQHTTVAQLACGATGHPVSP